MSDARAGTITVPLRGKGAMRNPTSDVPADNTRSFGHERKYPLCQLTALLCLFIVIQACSGSSQQDNTTPTDTISVTQHSTFDERYQPTDTIYPEQTEEHLVASVAEVAFDDSGRFLIVDDSEADVKLFGPEGQLITAIGRKGQGPGEFIQPRRAAFGPDGNIHVLDQSLNRIQVFNAEDTVVREIILREHSRLRDFEVFPDKTYAILATQHSHDPDNQDVVLHMDQSGDIIASYLPIANIVPRGEESKNQLIWGYPRNFFSDRRGDTVYVVSSVVGRLWKVVPTDSVVDSLHVEFPDYRKPESPLPDSKIQTGKDLIEYFHTRHLGGFIQVGEGRLFWPFIRGEWMRDSPRVYLHRLEAGAWEQIDGRDGQQVIRVVEMYEGAPVTLERPATDRMRLIAHGRVQ